MSPALQHEAALVWYCYAGVQSLAEDSAEAQRYHAAMLMTVIWQTCRLLPEEHTIFLTREMAATVLIVSAGLWQICHCPSPGSPRRERVMRKKRSPSIRMSFAILAAEGFSGTLIPCCRPETMRKQARYKETASEEDS